MDQLFELLWFSETYGLRKTSQVAQQSILNQITTSTIPEILGTVENFLIFFSTNGEEQEIGSKILYRSTCVLYDDACLSIFGERNQCVSERVVHCTANCAWRCTETTLLDADYS